MIVFMLDCAHRSIVAGWWQSGIGQCIQGLETEKSFSSVVTFCTIPVVYCIIKSIWQRVVEIHYYRKLAMRSALAVYVKSRSKLFKCRKYKLLTG